MAHKFVIEKNKAGEFVAKFKYNSELMFWTEGYSSKASAINAIESINARYRRAVKARGHFPTDEAALKLLYLVLNRSEKAWKMGPREWVMAKAQFAVIFGERFTRAMAA